MVAKLFFVAKLQNFGCNRLKSMPMYFITGNKDKFEEVKLFLPDIEQLAIDLPEIQELDARAVVRAKLLAAEAHKKAEYIVEDTSLYLDCLGGKLPGPFIKWFEKAIGNEGVARFAKQAGNTGGEAKTIVGYADAEGALYFAEGTLRGEIVSPCGSNDFGWGPIFRPEGQSKTFGEMTREEKHAISMRRKAIDALKKFLLEKTDSLIT